MVSFVPTWVLWIVFGFVIPVVVGIYRARREDQQKQRDKFMVEVRRFSPLMRSKGLLLESVEVHHGFMFGKGTATFVNEHGERGYLTKENL